MQYFQAKGVEIHIAALPTQEANKSFELVYEIARQLEAFGINRCCPAHPFTLAILSIC